MFALLYLAVAVACATAGTDWTAAAVALISAYVEAIRLGLRERVAAVEGRVTALERK